MSGEHTVKELELGRAIAVARRRAGMTQQELCMRANLSYSTLAKIERGAIKTPSVFTVAAIAEATGTTVEALAGVVVTNITSSPFVPRKSYKISKNGVSFVYFDVNGVLVRFFQRAFTALAADAGVSSDKVEALFWRYNDIVNKGDMSVAEFDKILSKHVGVSKISWLDYYMASIDPISEMHECLRWASENYRVGLMSNSMPGFIPEMIKRGLLPDIPYNAIIDSSEVKAIKPEIEIYEIGTKMSGVDPEQILLIDDGRTNLMAAEKLGWHVLWFDDYRPDEGLARVRQVLEF
jgi:FMN phosphatase YigB (HAD superfamily)/DNA-binding XRE family transcriptional regulator